MKPTVKFASKLAAFAMLGIIIPAGLGTANCVQAASTIQFTATSYAFAESAGIATITVQRLSDPSTTVSVDYTTADGTATNGLKYTAVSGTLVFVASETNQTIIVPILNNGFVEGTKTFRVILRNPIGGAVLGTRTTATVSITDNDVGIDFQFASYFVAEDAGAVMIGVVRGDDGTLPVTVGFATSDLSATNGLDYAGTNTTLSFAPQERLKFVSVPILNNTLKQPNRAIKASLANPDGATLGPQKTVTVTIVDNDQGFQFDSASYSVAEDAGVVRIGVLRGTDDTNSTVTVDFATADGTSTNGLDYNGFTNTLSFAPGEKVKLVSVPILNGGVNKPTQFFFVTLSNPTGGAVLGSQKPTTVTILDSNPGMGFELASYSVWENAGAISVTVLRGNGVALGPITADYATSDLTAKVGQDYQAVSGTLAFERNETVKTITIPILRDGLVTKNTSFSVILSNPTGAAALGRTSATVNIMDASGLTSRTVAPAFDTALTIGREGVFNILTWSGGGQLQRADPPTGPWQMLANASSPYAVQSALPATFYRVTRPRPVTLYIPSSYDSQTPAPLVILLHLGSGTGADEENYMRLQPLAESRGFLYCHPDATTDPALGANVWNATDATNDPFITGVDDAGYLRGLIEEIGTQFAVDPKRIYLIGHSNGAFMAYRMACQSADLIAGIASLEGATFLDTSRCAPSEPVNVLNICGTADELGLYAGSAINAAEGQHWPAFPGAMRTVQTWAGYNGSSGPVTDAAPSLDLTTDVAGPDTVITRYTNSPPGGAVELWTIIGGTHIPNLSSKFSPLVIGWLLAHPKP